MNYWKLSFILKKFYPFYKFLNFISHYIIITSFHVLFWILSVLRPFFSIFLQYSSCSCSYHVLTMFLRHPFPTTILLLSLHNYYIILHHTTPYYYIPTIVSYFSLRLIICLLLCLNYSIIFYHFPSFHPSLISSFVFYFICIIFLSFDIMCFIFDITCFTAP